MEVLEYSVETLNRQYKYKYIVQDHKNTKNVDLNIQCFVITDWFLDARYFEEMLYPAEGRKRQ
jgi:hypothetical protein